MKVQDAFLQMVRETAEVSHLEVAARYKIEEGRLKKSRPETDNLPRHIAIYLRRSHSPKSLVKIGSYSGIKNYVAVSSAVERLKARRSNDSTLRKSIDEIALRILKSQRQT
ncbi:MAG: hypothetical protein JRI58_14185 [Deltaproteobacteria bacterium]|nr:hypothetical protein [Deltaproteobacteria bacterium]